MYVLFLYCFVVLVYYSYMKLFNPKIKIANVIRIYCNKAEIKGDACYAFILKYFCIILISTLKQNRNVVAKNVFDFFSFYSKMIFNKKPTLFTDTLSIRCIFTPTQITHFFLLKIRCLVAAINLKRTNENVNQFIC